MSIFVREGGLKQYFKDAPMTSILIGLNLIMLLVVLIYGGFDQYTLLRLGALWAPLVKDGEEQFLMTSVDVVEPEDDGRWRLVGIFGDQKIVKGVIKGMNLVDHKILFEEDTA